MINTLFLCTGNSCRSIMAEALLRHHGQERFCARSAGSAPTGRVHPQSLETLRRKGIDPTGFESKSWDRFAGMRIDLVITVCDRAAGETCPVYPGNPAKGHWSIPDPAGFEGSPAEIANEFARVCDLLERRIVALVELPITQLSRDELQQRLREIAALP